MHIGAEHGLRSVGRLPEYNTCKGNTGGVLPPCSHVFNHPAPAGVATGDRMSIFGTSMRNFGSRLSSPRSLCAPLLLCVMDKKSNRRRSLAAGIGLAVLFALGTTSAKALDETAPAYKLSYVWRMHQICGKPIPQAAIDRFVQIIASQYGPDWRATTAIIFAKVDREYFGSSRDLQTGMCGALR